MRLLLLGGDARALHLANILKQSGFEVATLGLCEGDEDEKKNISSAQAILFPYPFSVRNGIIPTLTGMTIRPQDVLAQAQPNCLLVCGEGMLAYAQEEQQKRFILYQYTQNEQLKQANADLSAEATLYEVMQRSGKAICHQRILVTGYGLFGRALARRLQALGADVWVAARREEVRKSVCADGMHAIRLEEIADAAPRMDMMLNTIPSRVIGEKALRAFAAGTWLLELASAPYGFDRDVAIALGLRCEVLPALPARYAPHSAAQVLHDVVLPWLKEAEK